MNPAHKQRIVGAIVLVALGLIIVPTVLDFSHNERADIKGVTIPPGPDAMRMEVLPLEDWSQKVEPGVKRQEAEGKGAAVAPNGEVVESSAPPGSTAEPLAAAATAKSGPKAVPAAVQHEPKAAPAPAPAAPPAAKASVAAESWVVQVASLSTQGKANELRDQLRKGGCPALVERGMSGSTSIYRVKAGPVAKRTEADELKKKVKQITKLDGLVMLNQ